MVEGIVVALAMSDTRPATDDEAFAWFLDRQEDLAYASDDEHAYSGPPDVHPGMEYELEEDSFNFL